MKHVTLFSIYVLLTAVLVSGSIKSFCERNHLCIDIQKCPVFEKYSSSPFRVWPNDLKIKAKNELCNKVIVNDQVVLSVCCPTVINSRSCGVQGGDRIAKGHVAEPFEFPWMVLLREESGKFVCGGTLISSRYVLTAAHCVEHRNTKIVSVRLGENDITKDEDCIVLDGEIECTPPPQDIAVERAIRHPKYSDRYKKNDIALLRLATRAVLNHSVKTICLPDGTPGQLSPNSSMYIVSGWGMTEHGNKFDVLRYAEVPPVPLESCAVNVRNLLASVRLDQSHLCAGGIDQVDNCSGDSGGPLQYVPTRTSRVTQQGIVAFGVKSCGIKSEPGVYTNVANFITWIFENVDE